MRKGVIVGNPGHQKRPHKDISRHGFGRFELCTAVDRGDQDKRSQQRRVVKENRMDGLIPRRKVLDQTRQCQEERGGIQKGQESDRQKDFDEVSVLRFGKFLQA